MKNKLPMHGLVLGTRQLKEYVNQRTGEVTPPSGRFSFAVFQDEDNSWDVIPVKCSVAALGKLNTAILQPSQPAEPIMLNIEVNAYTIGKTADRDANAGVSYTLVEAAK